MTKHDKLIEKAKKQFQQSSDTWSNARKEALDDIRFARLGIQWPDEVKREREKDGRPCLTINRLPSFIRQVVNDARQNEPSIKVHPVDDNTDPDTAEVIDGIIRNIETVSNAELSYDKSLEDAVTCGWGFFRVDLEYAHDDSYDLDICINPIYNPNAVYFDANSLGSDASDWSYCFIEDNMPNEDFKAAYPNAQLSSWTGNDNSGWFTEDKTKVVEYWTRKEVDTELYLINDGQGTVVHKERYEQEPALQVFEIAKSRPTKTYKIKQYILTGMEVLEENDWPGRYIPIIPVFGDEIIEDEEKHFLSLTRQAKDAQRNYNYWRTASTEKVALATKAPWIGAAGSFDSDGNWQTANSENHPYLEYDPVPGAPPPQQLPPSMADAGSISEALNANDDMKSIMGIHDASLGLKSNETSGRAIMARQREGDVSTFHFIDNLKRGIQYAGKVILDLIPHVYNTPRILRVTGIDGTPDTVQINQEFNHNGMAKIHDLTKGKYDLIVKTGPSFTSRREEAATQMTEMLRSYPDAAPIIGDLVAKNLDWPGADEIAKRLKAMLPPQIQAMEKMDGLPPEAQAAIAQSQQQLEQLQQVISQGQQLLQERDEEIKTMQLQQKSKSEELAVKNIESQRKFESDMAKIQADLQIAAQKEEETNRRFIIEESLEALKISMTQTTEQLQPVQISIEQMSEQHNAIVEALSAISEKVAQLSQPKNKTMTITAPSGQVYEGAVVDGQMQIITPSGDEYNGTIEE